MQDIGKLNEFDFDCNHSLKQKRFSAVRYDNDIWMIGGELSGSSSVFGCDSTKIILNIYNCNFRDKEHNDQSVNVAAQLSPALLPLEDYRKSYC